MKVVRGLAYVGVVVGCCSHYLEKARAEFMTTGVYDEQTFQTNGIDVEAASNNVSLEQFKTDIADAFANGPGGVITFDDFGNFDATSFSVFYGASQTNSLTITRLTFNGSQAPNFNIGNSDTVTQSVSGNGATDANKRYLGSRTGDGSDWKLQFSKPLTQWGSIVLSRNDGGSSRTVDLIITLDNDTQVSFAQEQIAAVDRDIFFGYRAPTGRTIKHVAANQSGLMRWDDMAFVVAAQVPGDFDSDGDVDGADFIAWQTNYPKTENATLTQGDADLNGTVDGADFAAWQMHFPTVPAAGVSPVPEPLSATLALLVVPFAFLICRRSVR